MQVREDEDLDQQLILRVQATDADSDTSQCDRHILHAVHGVGYRKVAEICLPVHVCVLHSPSPCHSH